MIKIPKPTERQAIFERTLAKVENVHIIAERCKKLGFFDAPASTKYHLNVEGGLFMHSLHVTDALVTLTLRNELQWVRPESPYIVGMFHDICKADTYRYDKLMGWQYNSDTLLKGHGSKSVMILSSITELTEEEIACICYHMGAFTDKDEWNDYTRAIHKYPNVLWTHHADMIATHIIEVE